MELNMIRTSKDFCSRTIATLFLAIVFTLAVFPFFAIGTVYAAPAGATVYSPNECDPGLTAVSFGQGYTCTSPAGVAATNQQAVAIGGEYDPNTSCTGTSWYVNFGTCIGRSIAAWIGAGLIYIASWILGIAGSIFNWLIVNTVVNFDNVIYGTVASGVQSAWTAFRDIANIIIIGIFTFVAIEMILGTTTFGGRRTVAKVLLIAVLINFSLLFSRLIVESTNFVSRQFYNAVQLQSGAPTATNSNVNQYSAGVSGRFAQMMGVGGIQSTSNALFESAEKSRNGWIALSQGVLTAIIFVMAAFVFFYAAFLMIARAILLIFLIMTSSLAFASYLLPSSLVGNYGWTTWWNTLIKNAVFGPLLLILLWATMRVGEEMSRIPGSGQIGGLINNPANEGGVSSLFAYLIILGMLFASIKIASSFSSKIAGFSYAAFLPALGAGMVARAGGFAGRQTLGRVGVAQGNAFGAAAAAASEKGQYGRARLYDFASQRFGSLGKKDFNLMRSRLGAEMQSVAGVKNMDTLAGKALGGFEGVQKAYEKRLGETAKRLTLDEAKRQSKVANATDEQLRKDPHLAQEYAELEKSHKEAKEDADTIRKEVLVAQNEISDRYKTTIQRLEQDLGAKQAALSSNPSDPAAQREEQAARNALRAETKKQQSEMNVQNERIKRATKTIDRIREQFEDVSVKVADSAIAAGKLPERFKSAGEVAEGLTKSSFTSLLRATRPTAEGVNKLAEKIGKDAGKTRINDKETRDLARKIAKEYLGGEKGKK